MSILDNIINSLNGKADKDLLNVTDTGYSLMAAAGMPSNKYIDLTLGASGTSYTAPADGYFYLDKVAGSDWYYIQLIARRTDNNNVLYRLFDADYRTSPLCIIAPVKKGTVVEIAYNATGTTSRFRFIYAQGSESESN